MTALLEIRDLRVEYRRGNVAAVRGVSIDLAPGESLGLAGESGSGKSTLALSVLRLLAPEAVKNVSGRILFKGRDVLALGDRVLRSLRGGAVATVFQDPFSALNPVLTVGEQIEEVLELHAGGRNPARVRDLLARVRLPEPDRIYASYPHQLSGGQRQRVCLAMAVAGGPELLIADEPTTALDVTVQREILDLLDSLRRDLGMALLLVTHNIGLLSERTDRLGIMYAGELVEVGPTRRVLSDPRHPYTQGLLKSLPRLTKTADRLPALPGQPPDLGRLPAGCPFRPRCPGAFERCEKESPVLRPVKGAADRAAACHLLP
ncbi:MAG TPA: ABC transporter ATP-binding protein [Elusimicrobiota bacterium]|nr:ABC transporter ATP-binding protein [Elusimicrobiota bacterium]